ncbi:hypothetical protein GS8_2076 [Geobacillus stearothermophilus]|uniref:Uncharacterized protein n=1 Tax=Geobacillus stearothermophilus TaxID=1422 RepID=A0A150MN98_GEOSE|nr:hypothetical protein GS8_2076 [Geobacillus stearothermophilus]KYD25829.1 hypothetical protein B4109_1953 [Geobacillus stearothermophilus]
MFDGHIDTLLSWLQCLRRGAPAACGSPQNLRSSAADRGSPLLHCSYNEPPPLIEVGVSCFPFGGGCMIGWLAAYLQATPGTRPVGSHRQHEYP